jgi:hypothetical protein
LLEAEHITTKRWGIYWKASASTQMMTTFANCLRLFGVLCSQKALGLVDFSGNIHKLAIAVYASGFAFDKLIQL